MKRLSKRTNERVKKFLDVLNSYNLGQAIPRSIFEDIVRDEGEQGEVDHLVRYALDRAGERLGSGRYVQKSEKEVVVSAGAASMYDRRLRRAEFEKQIIAEALLGWLFGWESFPGYSKLPLEVETHFEDPSTDPETVTDRVIRPSSDFSDHDFWGRYYLKSGIHRATRLAQRLYRRLDHLRRTASLLMVTDSGTTNFTSIEHMLAASQIPFKTPIFGRDEFGVELRGNEAVRVITPTILTNSIPIADLIGRSKHRRAITLQVVGGTERFERRSICGESALLWLRACQASGVVASASLAILGTTGFRRNYAAGLSGFGCDDPSEGNLKMEMLKIAANGLRIITMDGNKFVTGELNCCFAALTAATLDLVVIGIGNTKAGKRLEQNAVESPSSSEDQQTGLLSDSEEIEFRVKEFCREANNQGVGVIVARRPTD